MVGDPLRVYEEAHAQLMSGRILRRVVHDPHQQAQNTTMAGREGTLTLELPIQRPDVLVPVIELFLRS